MPNRIGLAGTLGLLAAITALAAPIARAQDDTSDLTAPALSSSALASGARVHQLTGTEVFARNLDLGSINDVIVDLQSARVLAVIISTNGFFGGRLIAVRPNAIKVGAGGHMTIDLPLSAFSAAPDFVYADKSTPQ